MQPTVPSWVSWYRRVRARDALRGPEARARPRNRIAVYTFGRDDPSTHLIRLHSVLGTKRGAATPAAAGEPWLRERHALDTDPWRVPMPVMPADFKPHYQFEPISIVFPGAPGTGAPPAPGPAPAPAPAHVWGSAARGWAAGTALLAVLLLLVRTAEKCLDRKLFHYRNQNTTDHQREPEFPPDLAIDLPPPYSECAAPSTGPNPGPNTGANKPHMHEEPPPPYSACYVAYSNPKDGVPSVHFYNRRRPDEPGSSQNDLIENRGDTELMFDNGRIVERVERKETNDVPSGVSDTTNNCSDTADTTRDGVLLV